MTKGLYIHIPFCERKCNYCDFYSGSFSSDTKTRYVDKLCGEIKKWGRLNTCPIDTIYFGGGTPSLLSSSELRKIITEIRTSFTVTEDAEITCEINPSDDPEFIKTAAKLGVNRLSVGIQSSCDKELQILGRRHSFADAVNTIKAAKNLGISNISVDIMIGLPNSSIDSLNSTLKDILSLDVPHISSYILKIEESTPFYKSGIVLPEEDEVSDQYLYISKMLRSAGYEHYEISNFAKLGFQSRHNNKYWNSEEYIGIGPAAHSFFEGKRFYYTRSIESFMTEPKTVDDGTGGDNQEFIMLALRLSKGLVFKTYENKFGKLPNKFINRARSFNGLCIVDDEAIHLTDEGMLLSNTIISELIEVL